MTTNPATLTVRTTPPNWDNLPTLERAQQIAEQCRALAKRCLRRDHSVTTMRHAYAAMWRAKAIVSYRRLQQAHYANNDPLVRVERRNMTEQLRYHWQAKRA